MRKRVYKNTPPRLTDGKPSPIKFTFADGTTFEFTPPTGKTREMKREELRTLHKLGLKKPKKTS